MLNGSLLLGKGVIDRRGSEVLAILLNTIMVVAGVWDQWLMPMACTIGFVRILVVLNPIGMTIIVSTLSIAVIHVSVLVAETMFIAVLVTMLVVVNVVMVNIVHRHLMRSGMVILRVVIELMSRTVRVISMMAIHVSVVMSTEAMV